MAAVNALHILRTWSSRLDMNRKGIIKWKPELRAAVEHLIEALRAIDPEEEVELARDEEGRQLPRFIRSRTGETLGEFPIPSKAEWLRMSGQSAETRGQ